MTYSILGPGYMFVRVWFGLERYGIFFAIRGLIRPGPPCSLGSPFGSVNSNVF